MMNLLNLNETDNRLAGNAISFIDIDETTFHTFAKVGVYKDGKKVRELDNQQFNTYTLQPGESFNFDEFQDSKVFHTTSTPIKPMVKKIKKLIDCIKLHGKPEKVIFLTARSDFNNKELFLKTFRENGIDVDIPNVYVERSGNLTHIKKVADRKKAVMINYLKTGEFSAVRMFDDDEANLNTFKEFGREVNEGKFGILDAVRKKYPRARKVLFFPLKINNDGSAKLIKESVEVLTEGVEELQKYFPNVPVQTLQQVLKLDPTYTGGNTAGKYTKWILKLVNNNLKNLEIEKKWNELKKQYPNGINPRTNQKFSEPKYLSAIKDEDLSKIPNLLTQYDKIKNQNKPKIDSINSIEDLFKVVKEETNGNVDIANKINHTKQLLEKSIKAGAKKIYDSNNWVIIALKTFESSKVFGSDTNWCTTSHLSFLQYTGQESNSDLEFDNNLFVNADLTTGDLYQFHFPTASYMNSNDRPINLISILNKAGKEVENFYKQQIYNKLTKKNKENSNLEIYFGDKKLDLHDITNRSKGQIFNIITSMEEYKDMLPLLLAKNPDLSFMLGNKQTNEQRLLAIATNPDSIRYIKNPNETLQILAVSRDNSSIQYIKNPTPLVQKLAVSTYASDLYYLKNPSKELIDYMIETAINHSSYLHSIVQNIGFIPKKYREYVYNKLVSANLTGKDSNLEIKHLKKEIDRHNKLKR